MAHPDKVSGTEQEDGIGQNFVKSRSRLLDRVAGRDENVITVVRGCITVFRNMSNRLRDLSLGSLWGHCPLVVVLFVCKICQF